MSDTLRITEIFYSLQGEANTAGFPTVFIRLTGCPLRCQYCDTAYAFKGGKLWSLADILDEVKRYDTPYVTVTGGEPLAQKNCLVLLHQLGQLGYQVSLETSGALDIRAVDNRISVVLDLKTPGSGEEDKNLWENIPVLKTKDQVKFVICNENDFHWAKGIVSKYQLHERCSVLFSPSYEELSPKLLAEWILKHQLPVRMQMQLHKLIWGDIPGV